MESSTGTPACTIGLRVLVLVLVLVLMLVPEAPGSSRLAASNPRDALRLRCSSHAFGVLLRGTHDAAGFPIAAPERRVVPCRSRDHATH